MVFQSEQDDKGILKMQKKEAPKRPKHVKNQCKLCLKTVTTKTGLQCRGACQRWLHFECVHYTPGKIRDIKEGYIQVNCPCPTCNTTVPKEIELKPPFLCEDKTCPAIKPPHCEQLGCPSSFNAQDLVAPVGGSPDTLKQPIPPGTESLRGCDAAPPCLSSSSLSAASRTSCPPSDKPCRPDSSGSKSKKKVKKSKSKEVKAVKSKEVKKVKSKEKKTKKADKKSSGESVESKRCWRPCTPPPKSPGTPPKSPSPPQTPCPPPQKPCGPPENPCPPPQKPCPPPQDPCFPSQKPCPPPQDPCFPQQKPCPPPQSPCPPPQDPCFPSQKPCPPPQSPCPPPQTPCPPPLKPCLTPPKPCPTTPKPCPTPPKPCLTPPKPCPPPQKLCPHLKKKNSSPPSGTQTPLWEYKPSPCGESYRPGRNELPPPPWDPSCPSSPKLQKTSSHSKGLGKSNKKVVDDIKKSVSQDCLTPTPCNEELINVLQNLCSTMGELSQQVKNLMCKLSAN